MKLQPSAILSSGSGIPEENSVSWILFEELQTDDEDSDDAKSLASGPGHRLRPSLMEKETQARTDLKKNQVKANTKKPMKPPIRVNLRRLEKGNTS